MFELLCFILLSYTGVSYSVVCIIFFFQAEDGIRDLVRSRGLGDVYKRQGPLSVRASLRPCRFRP